MDKALRMMLAASHTLSPDELPVLMARSAQVLGAESAQLFLVDYEQLNLVRLSVVDEIDADLSLPIQGTLAGRAFTTQVTQLAQDLSQATRDVWIPLVDGTDRVGVLRFCFAQGVEQPLVEELELVAALVAELVVVRSASGDKIERTKRTFPLTLPAEIQWRLLPPLTVETSQAVISGMLSPAHAVAGDSFDYALDARAAHLAMFDAMGHGLEAALMATVAISGFRNARRAGMGLDESARAIDKAITVQFGPDRFVTGVVAELDLASGRYRWVNAGHPPVLVVRHGQVIKVLDSLINPPFGLIGDDAPLPDVERLEPGDRLLLYTDGVTDARSPEGELFGVERLVDLITRESAAGRPAAETMRRLTLALTDHHRGVLDDDATTLLVEWRGRR